jgi:cell wall-associated NlpC family hydrolase
VTMRALRLQYALAAAVIISAMLPAQRALAFADVPSSHWAYRAITYVAETRPWMRDYGAGEFRPRARETRSQFARAMVLAFAPAEPTAPSITFADLPQSDAVNPFANVAVKLGWMRKVTGEWRGGDAVRMREVDRALVLALGLDAPAAGLGNIREADGDRYSVNKWIPYLQLARWIGLHYNHAEEQKDLQPATAMRREEVAYSLWAAATSPSWKIAGAAVFNEVQLPALAPETSSGDKALRAMTSFALNQITFPYIYAGEWNSRTSSTYCCGYQPQGGFDCSGFIWFVMKRNEGGYNAAQFRSYPGWSIPERGSKQMAKMSPRRIGWERLRPGDVMFFSSSGGTTWDTVTHAGIYLGNGWMVHSRAGGPRLERVSEGWYKDRFVYGRRVIAAG